MANVSNFVQIRRGILQHIQEGRLSPNQAFVHLMIILLADASTGLWRGSAPALVVRCDGNLSLNAAQRALEALEKAKYLKRFRSQGERGNYPILVNKYLITAGRLKNGKVNAERTVDWRQIVVDDATDDAAGVGTDVGTGVATPVATPTATYSTRQDGQEVYETRDGDSTEQSGPVTVPHNASHIEPRAKPKAKAKPTTKTADQISTLRIRVWQFWFWRNHGPT